MFGVKAYGLLRAHAPARFPGSVSGTAQALACSPWSAAFPPHPPLAIARFCSDLSSVLRRSTTPRQHAWGTCRSSRSPPGPPTALGHRRGLPVLAHEVFCTCLGSTTPQDRLRTCLDRTPPCCFLNARRHQHPGPCISKLNTQPVQTPVQRFKCGLTVALTWLGARAVRYSFSVRLFHSLLHAGLSRRYPGEGTRPTREARTVYAKWYLLVGSSQTIFFWFLYDNVAM
jgi:hypothetical protein